MGLYRLIQNWISWQIVADENKDNQGNTQAADRTLSNSRHSPTDAFLQETKTLKNCNGFTAPGVVIRVYLGVGEVLLPWGPRAPKPHAIKIRQTSFEQKRTSLMK